MVQLVIDVGIDFTRFPAGRYRDDGPYSGQRFREDILVPALKASGTVRVLLDGTKGYGSSFLEEAFAGIVRAGDFSADELLAALHLESDDATLVTEIREYISATRH